ncbi:hypothetical protein OS493_003257 [Desmophyllum pertusum]|uniref:Secreted protein n=1 Tax=Desmophyllum pertusum TaxID=174260 RepID=A0A9X0CH92_9CNID|nr:hypothetical protein OS493_003257 [Desmophyllum pertusum]
MRLSCRIKAIIVPLLLDTAATGGVRVPGLLVQDLDRPAPGRVLALVHQESIQSLTLVPRVVPLVPLPGHLYDRSVPVHLQNLLSHQHGLHHLATSVMKAMND